MNTRVVTTLIGTFLIVAAVLKAVSLDETSVTPGRLSDEWRLGLASVGAELFLGVWLAVGVFPATSRRAAAAAFLAFAGVSLSKSIDGQPSCGCLGSVEVDPRFMLVIDLAVLVALLFVRDRPDEVRGRGTGALVLLGAAVFAAGLCVQVYASATSIARGLWVDERVHDFGETAQHTILTHDFTLTNNCRYPVELVKSSSSCGCTTITAVDGEVIQVGGSLIVPVTLTVKESDDRVGGRLTLYCRRAGSTSLPSFFQDLSVEVKVEPDYWVRPLIVDFGVVTGDSIVAKRILVRPHRLPSLAVTGVTSSKPGFRGRVLPDRTADGDVQIEVAFDGSKVVGTRPVETTLTLTTSSLKRRTVAVLAKTIYESPVAIEPEAVVVSGDAVGDVIRYIVVTTANPSRVTGAGLTTQAGTVSVIEESPSRWRLKIGLPAHTHVTGLSGELRFTVSSVESARRPEARAVVVPLFRLRNNIN